MKTSPTITWYEHTAPDAPVFPELKASLDADVCILGSGMVGTSAALHLAEAGKRVIVLEPSRIGYGSSGRAGGLIESGLHVQMDDLRDLIGTLSAHKFWQASVDARNLLLSRIRENDMACGLSMGLFKLSNKLGKRKDMQHNAFYFSNSFEGESISYVNERMLKDFGIHNLVTGMRYAESGAFNPLSFLYGLAELSEKAGAKIYENSPSMGYKSNKDGVEIKTKHGRIQAKKLVICGNAYMHQLDSPEKTRTVSTQFFQLVTEPIDVEVLRSVIPNRETLMDDARLSSYISVTHDNRLIIGGPVKSFIKKDTEFANYILKKVGRTLPELKNALIAHYLWRGPVGVPMNYMPVFSHADKNIYTAHGFNGHGVSLAYMAGKVLAEAATGDDEMFELFSRIQQMPMPRAVRHILAKWGLLLARFENRIF